MKERRISTTRSDRRKDKEGILGGEPNVERKSGDERPSSTASPCPRSVRITNKEGGHFCRGRWRNVERTRMRETGKGKGKNARISGLILAFDI